MSDKSAGIDFDRQVFVQQPSSSVQPLAKIGGLIFGVGLIVVIAILGYRLLPQVTRDSGGANDATVAALDKRLAAIESRLEKIEAARKAVVPVRKEEAPEVKETSAAASKTKPVYQVSGMRPQIRTVTVPATGPDPQTAQRLASIQERLGALQTDATASHDAWQATTDKLADMAGQVGTQGVEILKSQDELNQLLARTEMEAIPFELLRGSNPQPIGPVSLVLKSANPKTNRYTVCVYIQPSCIELKDRTLNEVVQFVVARNSTPLEVIATRMTKDEITGYLEVPRDQSGH